MSNKTLEEQRNYNGESREEQDYRNTNAYIRDLVEQVAKSQDQFKNDIKNEVKELRIIIHEAVASVGTNYVPLEKFKDKIIELEKRVEVAEKKHEEFVKRVENVVWKTIAIVGTFLLMAILTFIISGGLVVGGK